MQQSVQKDTISLLVEQLSNDDTATLVDNKEQLSAIRRLKIMELYNSYKFTPGGIMPFLETDRLNLFKSKFEIYSHEYRGREKRSDPDYYELPVHIRPERNKQTVVSHHLGIMKAFMPLPQQDALNAVEQTSYVRHADRNTYEEGAIQVEMAFFNQVTPFSSSISGSLLRQLVLIDQLYQKKQFDYANNETQLKLYFKNHIALGIYFTGCHSLNEFTSVLELPEVQYAFRKIPGFSDLRLNTLFKDENKPAFNKALLKTIQYNERILSRKKLHQQLLHLTNSNHQDQTNSSRFDDIIKRINTLESKEHFLSLIERGLSQQIVFFIQLGQEVNFLNNMKQTPLDYALSHRQWLAAVLLMKAGGKANHWSVFLQQKLCFYLNECDLVNIKLILSSPKYLHDYFEDEDVLYYIYKAIIKDRLEIIKSVIEAGFPINYRDSKGVSLVMMAADKGAKATLNYLIDHNACIDDSHYISPPNKPFSKLTALHLAVIKQDPSCCQLLINGGASIEARDSDNKMPEDYANGETLLVFQSLETNYIRLQQRLAKKAWNEAIALVVSYQTNQKFLIQCIDLITSKYSILIKDLILQLDEKNQQLLKKSSALEDTISSSTLSALIHKALFTTQAESLNLNNNDIKDIEFDEKIESTQDVYTI